MPRLAIRCPRLACVSPAATETGPARSDERKLGRSPVAHLSSPHDERILPRGQPFPALPLTKVVLIPPRAGGECEFVAKIISGRPRICNNTHSPTQDLSRPCAAALKPGCGV